ncbi:MAG: hypothetical protein HZB37_05420, partial [Planctomycetes bacterium]|nr:hypothetical protein [Planctomycetota bacterium]
MNKYIPLLCIPLLPLLGCSTTPDQARDRADNAASRRLEKRIDDLSNTISLLANDGNRLHNDLAEVKALTKDVQLKTEGLATSIRDLEERMDGVVSSVKDKNTSTSPPQPESNATPDQTPLADFSKLLEKVISDVQQVVSSEKRGAAATDEQAKPSSPEGAPAVETKSAGTDKKEDVQKEAVRLVVEGAQKPPEEKNAVESIQKGSETANQASEPKTDAVPPKQDVAVDNLLSEPRTREPYLKEAIGRLAEKVFPDNKGVRWNIISFDHKAHLTHTEAEPLQADLGYPRFKFVVSFKTPENP